MESNQYVHFMITQALMESLKGVLGDSSKDYMAILFKMCSGLTSQQDVESANAFFAKLYQAGYMKSVEAHKEAFAKMGVESVVLSTHQNSDGTETACSL